MACRPIVTELTAATTCNLKSKKMTLHGIADNDCSPSPPPSRLARVVYPETITPLRRPLLRATVSFFSSREFHRDNNLRRREEVDDGSKVGEREGGGGGKTEETKSRQSRSALPRCRWGGRRGVGSGKRRRKRRKSQREKDEEVGGRATWEDGIGRIVLIKRPRNVGRWLNPVIDLEARAPRERRARGKYSNSFITRSKNR